MQLISYSLVILVTFKDNILIILKSLWHYNRLIDERKKIGMVAQIKLIFPVHMFLCSVTTQLLSLSKKM